MTSRTDCESAFKQTVAISKINKYFLLFLFCFLLFK
jgi:hypothetical protein